MIFGSLTLLITLALGALFLGRLKLARFSLITALVIVFGVGTGAVPSFLLRQTQVYARVSEETWSDKNLIVVLGGGNQRWSDGTVHSRQFQSSRVEEAARLYQSCHRAKTDCKVITSGGDPSHLELTEAEAMRLELVELGVTASDILKEDKSNNTFQNAQFSAPLIEALAAATIYLVSSGIHLSRARLYFEHFDVNATPAPADDLEPIFTFIPLGYNFAVAEMALHESLGIWRFHIYNWLGLNARVSKPNRASDFH